jgi:hypothetical protein
VHAAPPTAVPFDVAYCTVDVPDEPVLVTVMTAVCDSSSVYVDDENCIVTPPGDPEGEGVGVGTTVPVGDGDGVGTIVGVGLGLGVAQVPAIAASFWPCVRPPVLHSN